MAQNSNSDHKAVYKVSAEKSLVKEYCRSSKTNTDIRKKRKPQLLARIVSPQISKFAFVRLTLKQPNVTSDTSCWIYRDFYSTHP